MTRSRQCDYDDLIEPHTYDRCRNSATFQLVAERPGVIAHACDSHYAQQVADILLGIGGYYWPDAHWEQINLGMVPESG